MIATPVRIWYISILYEYLSVVRHLLWDTSGVTLAVVGNAIQFSGVVVDPANSDQTRTWDEELFESVLRSRA